MNKARYGFVLFSCLLLMHACKKSSSNSEVNLTKGLLAYYPFNGNANDASGNAFNGSIKGNVSFTNDAGGKPNSAVSFDGSTGYIIVNDSSDKLVPDVLSISMLVNLTDVTGRDAFLNKVNFNDATGLSYSIGIASPGIEKFQYVVQTDDFGCTSGNYSGIYFMDNGYQIQPNQWYHLVAVFSDSMQKIYLNGVLKASATRDNNSINRCVGSSLLLGGWWKNDIISMHGSLDEVRIYNRELNQVEINQLAKAID